MDVNLARSRLVVAGPVVVHIPGAGTSTGVSWAGTRSRASAGSSNLWGAASSAESLATAHGGVGVVAQFGNHDGDDVHFNVTVASVGIPISVHGACTVDVCGLARPLCVLGI